MKNFSDYMLLAINRQGLKGNNALARELGIKNSSMSALYTGKALPAESTMIKLAELAGMPKEEALIDLNVWRSEQQPDIKNVWLRISKMIKIVLVFLSLSLVKPAFSCVESGHVPADNLYYVYKRKFRFC